MGKPFEKELASKISSIGAFMAAFEKKIAVAHAIGRHELKNINAYYWSDDYKNRFKENLHLFDGCDFLAELTQHIPPKGILVYSKVWIE